jgi:hypothetical protein
VKTQVRSVRKSGVFNKNLMDFGKSLPKKALRKIKNYFQSKPKNRFKACFVKIAPSKSIVCVASKLFGA